MRRLKLLICFICFFLDVHVRAEECKTAPCLINAKTRRVEWKEPHVVADKGSLAEWRGQDIVHLVRGTFLAAGAVRITTPFANFACDGECEALFERGADS